MSKDLSARLLATFTTELEEQVRAFNAELLRLEQQPEDPDCLRSVFRIAHTVKGAAGAAGVRPVEQTCHALESLLARARERQLSLSSQHFHLFFQLADALGDAAKRLRQGHAVDEPVLLSLRESLSGRTAGSEPPAALAETSTRAPAPELARGDGQVRVAAERVDLLLATREELLAVQARLKTDRDRLEKLLARVTGAVARDGGHLLQSARTTERSLQRVAGDLADRIWRLRMRPFADACEPLPRLARDLATESGKEVQLEIRGSELEADRAVLDGLREVLLHLVRNAIGHGIEPPAQRQRAGKPRVGTVSAAAAVRGDRFVVSVRDDGKGLDVVALRGELERRGLPVPADDQELMRALFHGGLTTTAQPTSISGRGVGLDVVRSVAERLRARVNVSWHEGRGTEVVLDCPLSLAAVRVLLVRVGTQILGLATARVERVLRIAPEQLHKAEGRLVIRGRDRPIALIPLSRVLGAGFGDSSAETPTRAVVIHSDDRAAALGIDELLEEFEAVLRPLRRVHARPPLVNGSAILPTGEAALVLDADAVLSAALAIAEHPFAVPSAAAAAPRRRILVVDDSITTRTLEQSILEAAGFEALTAVDGVEAWKLLQEQGCDLVVADIEMPRMDGFELCATIRASKRWQNLPVVLVTALEAPEQRAHGLEAGADAYLGKSTFDQQTLLETIRRLLDLDQ